MCPTGFAVGWIEYFLCNFIQFGNYRIHFHTCALLSSPVTVSDKCAVGSNEHSLCIFRPLAYLRLTIHKYTHCHRLTLSMTGFAVDSFILYATLFNLVTSESLFMHRLTCQRFPTVLGVYKEYRLCILLHVMNSDKWRLPCSFVVTKLNRCIFLHVAKGD